MAYVTVLYSCLHLGWHTLQSIVYCINVYFSRWKGSAEVTEGYAEGDEPEGMREKLHQTADRLYDYKETRMCVPILSCGESGKKV